MNIQNGKSPYVLFNIAGLTYAISCNCVLSLEQLTKIIPIPTYPIEIRGVVNFRNSIIELIDSRVLFNEKSIDEDIRGFNETMDCMKEAHLEWIQTLEDCILNGKEFTLSTDPHKCAFGKWYDNYKTNDSILLFELAKFDKPHKAIHQIGIDCVEMKKRGNEEGAIALIKATKDTALQQMINLFGSTKEAYANSRREILVVLGKNEQNAISISVDEIAAIEYLYEIDNSLIKDTSTNAEYITSIGKRKDGSVVYLINDEYLLETYAQADKFELEKLKL